VVGGWEGERDGEKRAGRETVVRLRTVKGRRRRASTRMEQNA